MSAIRQEKVNAALNKADVLVDYDIYDDVYKRFEFRKKTILADESLTKDEKLAAINMLNEDYDYYKITYNEGIKRICEDCQEKCLATLFCEYCVRNYLKINFSNWTSKNDDVDNLIQKCQMESLTPYTIIEWIPFNNLQNIKYLTKGGFSEIYSADWIDGHYNEWNRKENRLRRLGTHEVILKGLSNVESADRSWFEEAKSHLSIGNKWPDIVQCFGLTLNPLNENFMLVMRQMDIDLRKYLQQNHYRLIWKEKVKITVDIIESLFRIHEEKAIHRDLHSGNILYFQHYNDWCISDLGFCGPADKPLKSIYGNLPYIAPEVITGKECTFASDIYSIAMLMWEISSGQPPFINYKHDYDLAMFIINGMRPKIIPGTPLEYKELMIQCWNAEPSKRPDIKALRNKMKEINKSYYQDNENRTMDHIISPNNDSQLNTSFGISSTSSSMNSLIKNFNSKIYSFEHLPEPRNATEEEQIAYHSIQHNLTISENIQDILSEDKTKKNDSKMSIHSIENNEKNSSKRIYLNIISDDAKKNLNNKSKKRRLNNNKGMYAYEIEYRNIQKNNMADTGEIYNDPNLHSEDQDELEIPKDI